MLHLHINKFLDQKLDVAYHNLVNRASPTSILTSLRFRLLRLLQRSVVIHHIKRAGIAGEPPLSVGVGMESCVAVDND